MDLSKAIEAKSDQLNAVDIAVPEVVTIAEVRPGDKDQPVWIVTAEHPGRPWKPSKTALRMLVHAWGTTDGNVYVGRRVELFNDKSVTWAGEAVGGIRVSAVSHIDKPTKVNLPVSRGKRKSYTINPLPDAPAPQSSTGEIPADVVANVERAKQDGNLGSYLAYLEDNGAPDAIKAYVRDQMEPEA